MYPPSLAHLTRVLASCTLALVAVLCLQPAPAIAERASWVWPISGERNIMRDYDAPSSAYAAGHRGIDLPASAGTDVVAPVESVVSFAGVVVGRGVLTLRTGDIQVSFEAVNSDLHEGDLVQAGDVIATTALGSHCECLHVGVRKAGAYLSPLAYFSNIAPAVLQAWDDQLWMRAGQVPAPQA
jgi:murein DD-endopeptidase MepM/ murein hydrolase activator NlpD